MGKKTLKRNFLIFPSIPNLLFHYGCREINQRGKKIVAIGFFKNGNTIIFPLKGLKVQCLLKLALTLISFHSQ